ncbi:SMI1/KNR4 family protein [Nostoc sp. FACHB-87]|uniref:SMI1/KNR4 family protein n=1 Tax=Nostocaceae TaxID=1162 RepID=UPI001684B54A|nr:MULTISPECIES: SMI1/KNR4 family protein [Nostocaceae]MBD2454585.1 SMI1/KNR4 family protein [Nostoc sp. FACHB-87]MBD2476370.1 SMI1/KNR4 family protein [Anabaena sp. FACHB-83]
MNNFNWYSFLKKESKKVLDNYENGEIYWTVVDFPDEAIQSEWLGLPRASEKEITATESRLRTKLPLSYREFLKVTNGWPGYPGVLRLRMAKEIDWFFVEHQNWIDIWTQSLRSLPPISDEQYLIYGKNLEQDIRVEYLQTNLQISDALDGEVILLNPQITHNQEWEAWLFSNHIPGVKRYRSFWEMLTTRGMGATP